MKKRKRYRSALQICWNDMKQRCFNENHHKYYLYGARGITVCEEWISRSQPFVDWAMAHGWEKGLQIDRIDNDGDYTPENCRWATPRQQANNRRTNVRVNCNGLEMTIAQWARFLNKPYDSMYKYFVYDECFICD